MTPLWKGTNIGGVGVLYGMGKQSGSSAQFSAVSQQWQELAGVISAGDDHDLVDSSLYQRMDWIEDHWLVVDRQQMFVRDASQRMQA